jgi:putative SOS response-associated peptidase YedK
MCGRFVRKATEEEVLGEFDVEPDDVSFGLAPRYNIAPGQQAAAVLFDGRRKVEGLQWGLIPFWAKDPKIGYKLINARAETLASKPSFRNSLKKKRCLVVADGFYEWRKDGSKKTPMFVRMRDGRPFGFAGLYDDWKTPEGRNIRTFTIITTSPNKLLEPIHDRMPVILTREAYGDWLDTGPDEPAKLLGLLKAYPDREMEAYRVGLEVNSPKNDGPECIQPV